MGLFFPLATIKHTRFANMPDKKLPAVPETILKRRKRQSENRAARAAQLAKDRLARRAKRVDIFKRAEKYVKEYRDQERDDLRLKREARKSGNYHVPAEPKLALSCVSVVSTRSLLRSKKFCNSSVLDRSTTVFSSS